MNHKEIFLYKYLIIIVITFISYCILNYHSIYIHTYKINSINNHSLNKDFGWKQSLGLLHRDYSPYLEKKSLGLLHRTSC